MPPKRQGLPKKTTKKKSSLLFDFINDITYTKTNIINQENKGAYSRYMITKFLSMHEPYLPIVDLYLNKFQGSLSDEEFHKFCIAVIPKKKLYLKYVNIKPIQKDCEEKLKYIREYFEVSNNQAYEYYLEGGDEFVTNIKKMYGVVE